MSTIFLIIVCVALGYGGHIFISRRLRKTATYGYEADVYQWLFQNGVKADQVAVNELFVLLKQYLKDNENTSAKSQ